MTDKFDATKHQHGWAYWYKQDEPPETLFYPTYTLDGFNVYGHMPCAPNKDTKLFNYNLTRAPEHDLIPRATADKLAKALSAMECFYGLDQDCDLSRLHHKDARQALNEYRKETQ